MEDLCPGSRRQFMFRSMSRFEVHLHLVKTKMVSCEVLCWLHVCSRLNVYLCVVYCQFGCVCMRTK